MFVPVQGVHSPSKEGNSFKEPLILIMPVIGLCIDLRQLENEATP